MVGGSFNEDLGPKDVLNGGGGYRSLNHFYDPLDNIYGKGLSNVPTDTRDIAGTNSFAWASISNCAGYNYSGRFGVSYFGGNINTSNTWSWQNARGYEWLGLTAANPIDRQTYLANMFRAVGQVMHLLEDCSQPQHIRNEQHLDALGELFWESRIEDWGGKHVLTLNYGDGSMLDWRGAVFTKLEDFWDRHLYNGNRDALIAAENGGQQLGLAEWCNGNFPGERHSFPEYFARYNSDGTKNIMWYPYPSRVTSTDYSYLLANPASGVGSLILKNGLQRQGIYLNKVGDGVQYPCISRFTYLGAKFPKAMGAHSTTIGDENVISNFHNVFIPKAVKYSAGLLDYFFRGQLALSLTRSLDQDNDHFTIAAQNTSGQTFSGGTFSLYQEDVTHTRTLLYQTNMSGSLPDGDSETMVVPSGTLLTTNASFVLIYQGTIGVTDGVASDPVDAGIAIAAMKFGVFANNEFIHVGCDRLPEGDILNYHTVPAATAYSPVSEADAEYLADQIYVFMYPFECN